MNKDDKKEKSSALIDVDEEAQRILATYKEVFGDTTLCVRLEDIAEESDELINFTSEENLKEELSDLISTCLALAAEKGWKVTDLIDANINKVKERHTTGWYLTHT